jgi:hypothetical protein
MLGCTPVCVKTFGFAAHVCGASGSYKRDREVSPHTTSTLVAGYLYVAVQKLCGRTGAEVGIL